MKKKNFPYTLSVRLDSAEKHYPASAFYFILFLEARFSKANALPVDPVHCLQDPQTSFFIKTFIKNVSHDTIHIFKNYFTTVFSVFSKINGIQTHLKKNR